MINDMLLFLDPILSKTDDEIKRMFQNVLKKLP